MAIARPSSTCREFSSSGRGVCRPEGYRVGRFDANNGFGFRSLSSEPLTISDQELLQHVETADLQKFGFLPS